MTSLAVLVIIGDTRRKILMSKPPGPDSGSPSFRSGGGKRYGGGGGPPPSLLGSSSFPFSPSSPSSSSSQTLTCSSAPSSLPFSSSRSSKAFCSSSFSSSSGYTSNCGSSPSAFGTSGSFNLLDSEGTAQVSVPTNIHRAYKPPISFAGMRGPATSSDRTPPTGYGTFRCGWHCCMVCWQTAQSLL